MNDAQACQLRDRFMRLPVFGTVDRQTIGLGWFEILQGLYESRDRHYHNLAHVADLLVGLDHRNPFGVNTRQGLEVELAIWFHDAIYDVARKDNEDRSADLLKAFVMTIGEDRHGFPFTDALEAINATTHAPPPPCWFAYSGPSEVTKVMLDLDLAGFADPWEVFDAKNYMLRREHGAYPDDQWRFGRAKIITSFLERPQIYYVFRDLEKPARANLQRHLRELVGS